MVQTNSARVAAPIALLTDFGLSDGYVGVMKGVISGILPGVPLIDITHDIAPQDIAAGAWVLACSYRYFPRDTVFVCVVDPGVGSQRRPVALRAGDWFFVGPDNGLFSYITQEQPVQKAVALTNAAYHLPQVSATFQGRDIFSPAGAYIAGGTELAALGPAIETSSLQRLQSIAPRWRDEYIHGQVVHIDHFGNLVTNIPFSMVPDLFTYPQVRLTFAWTGAAVSARRHFFAETGGQAGRELLPFIYVDSSGYLGVAVQNKSAASVLEGSVGEPVALATAL